VKALAEQTGFKIQTAKEDAALFRTFFLGLKKPVTAA